MTTTARYLGGYAVQQPAVYGAYGPSAYGAQQQLPADPLAAAQRHVLDAMHRSGWSVQQQQKVLDKCVRPILEIATGRRADMPLTKTDQCKAAAAVVTGVLMLPVALPMAIVNCELPGLAALWKMASNLSSRLYDKCKGNKVVEHGMLNFVHDVIMILEEQFRRLYDAEVRRRLYDAEQRRPPRLTSPEIREMGNRVDALTKCVHKLAIKNGYMDTVL